MINTDKLKANIERRMHDQFETTIEKATPQELHHALSREVMHDIKDRWDESRASHLEGRRACYLSMEFLVGRAVYNNLLCTGLTDNASRAFEALGRDLSELEEIEDAALGNGGLGRLAACFLDSAATHDIPLDGYGIRYKYGLFRQEIDGTNGQQEYADDWQRYGDPWSERCDIDTVTVTYSDYQVRAVPYDMPVIGYATENVGTLRLWQAEPVVQFDFEKFNRGDFHEAWGSRSDAENISAVLYPNDSFEEGRILRLRQEYFFSSASVQDIVRKHERSHGSLDCLPDFVQIQLNDTHPVISIPELIRILIDERGYEFPKALSIAQKTFNYTNHTIMQEALEKWDIRLINKLLPRIGEICLMISEYFKADMYAKKPEGFDKKKIAELAPIGGGKLRMANMACYVGSHINGVAAIHTEILKAETLADWYKLYPDRFLNETNGITQRRWLRLCNPELSALITRLLGSEFWVKDLDELAKLKKYADDESVLREFIAIKKQKKQQLADYITSSKAERDFGTIDTNSIFDTQIKRLHEYKRQLLNAFSILYIYYGLKDGSIEDFTPMTFIFGAKAAPGYRRAKAVIRFIENIAELIEKDDDPKVKGKLKVIFVQNYNVSYAEKLVAGSDVSEQISTAGTEASGTGNMKLMLNGTVTLGTYDGANIEIAEEAGEENNYIFGARVEELEKIMPDYDPRELLADPKIKRVLDKLIDGSFYDSEVALHPERAGEEGTFTELYAALTDGASWHVPDHYYLLGDLNSYVEAKLKVNREYRDELAFARKCWLNMCSAGKFSSDRTIKDYAKNIWKLV
ncbi:starch phosphorylase [Ruminococcus sp. YE71]|uniref:glycogen/starch/alpha-glucan phosphorylase n=1 Tax=unclassified Ruminococcus TaxID=2608920 RepID=UPI0008867CDB|nr:MULTISPECIES: glycogen/starch/alpha-glucan phosphorylase [unclassified Ruminococcus]SDA11819.1 starch phosphorylase [Ruminococcus sp. YE78]SFW15791.1 starch phosphorylase [Ruminococcus sp. YE71]